MARYLVVSHLTAGSPEFRRQIRNRVQTDPEAEFTLLVPTSPPGHRLVWNDAEAMRAARMRADAAGALMRECGANVSRTAVGARDPLSAIDDEVREHPGYDQIIICTLPAGISRWLKLDLVSRARQHTGLPVTHVVAQQEWMPPPEETPAPAVATMEPPRETAAPEGAGPQAAAEASPGEAAIAAPPREPAEAAAELLTVAGAGLELTDAATAFERTVRETPGLEPELAAMIALRVAHQEHCAYAWQEAVMIARGMGIPDARITALEHWRASEHVRFDDRARAVLGYIDALHKGGNARREARGVLAGLASPETVAAITLLAGLVRTQADLAEAYGLKPGDEFVGWDLYMGRATATL